MGEGGLHPEQLTNRDKQAHTNLEAIYSSQQPKCMFHDSERKPQTPRTLLDNRPAWHLEASLVLGTYGE